MIDYGVISGSTGESLALGLRGGAPPATTSVGAVDFAAVMSDLAAASLGTSDNLSALDAAALVASDDKPRATIASSRELTALLEQIAAQIAAKDGSGEDGDPAATDLLAGAPDAKPLSDVRSPQTAVVATASEPKTDTNALAGEAAALADDAVDREAVAALASRGEAPAASDDDARYAPAPGRDEIRRILASTATIDEPGVSPPPAAVDGKNESGQSGRNPFLPLARLIERSRAEAAEAPETSAPLTATTGSISMDNGGTLAEASAASPLMFRTAPPAGPLTSTATFSDEPHANASNTVSIVQAIRLQWSQGAGEARIQLEPEQFGALTVTLRVVQGQVVARVESDTAAVREWLKANQDVLHDALADRELSLEHLEIAEPEESDFSREQRSRDDAPPEQQWHPRRWRRPDTGMQFEVVV